MVKENNKAFESKNIPKSNNGIVKKHYRKHVNQRAKLEKLLRWDKIAYKKEIEFIENFLKFLTRYKKEKLKILDLGCGDGYTLAILVKRFPKNYYWGVDFVKELIDIAKTKKLLDCKFLKSDARSLKFRDKYFDFIFTQRCITNILNWRGQKKALNEIWRTLKPDGYYLMIECFTDGLKNNNKARKECGLDELKTAYHNKYLEKRLFLRAIKGKFKIIKPAEINFDKYIFHQNFLSSHYFIARVLHALVTKGPQIKNTEFVRFFSFLPPIGNYSPLQAYILQKLPPKKIWKKIKK